MSAKIKQQLLTKEKTLQLWVKIIFVVLFVVYVSVFLARQVNFVTADLGRHITNGKIFVEEGKIISTNYYSYTEPDYPAINHHWGSGVIFYFVHKWSGFKGLSVFYVAMVLGSGFFFAASALRFADARFVFFTSVISVPLLAYRTEIRPEGISLFFTGLIFYFLILLRERYRSGLEIPTNKRLQIQTNEIPVKAFLFSDKSFLFPAIVIIITQLIWVNCHIFFFMGFMLTGFFIAEEFFIGKNSKQIKHLFILFSAQIIISFFNPFFIEGFLTPFTIFKEYGYMIAENQGVIFMQERFGNKEFIHFEAQSLVLLCLFAIAYFYGKWKPAIIFLFPVLAFGFLGFKAVRGIPLFALAAIPAGAFLLQELSFSAKWLRWTLATVAALIVVFGFQSGLATDKKNKKKGATYKEPAYLAPVKYNTGTGLFPDINLSARFFLENKIKGPVFNNYDIGGYLIYHLYNKEKVFVDNRPEAYSVDFFKKTYIPMQEDMQKFREIEQQYNFNCIWFYRHDNTPWAQPFLIKLIEEPDYAPVFVDRFTIIFLKRNKQNSPLIEKYELPKSMFRAVTQ